MSNLHRSEFLKELKFEFPEIRDDLNRQFGLIGEEFSVFKQFLQKQINDKHVENTKSAIAIINKFYAEGSSKIKSQISLLVTEDLDFSVTAKRYSAWAYDLLSEPLKAERKNWRTYMGYAGV